MSRLYYERALSKERDLFAEFSGSAHDSIPNVFDYFHKRAEDWRANMARLSPELYANAYADHPIGTPFYLEFKVVEIEPGLVYDDGITGYIVYCGDSPDRYLLVD